jgi:hypothetical protein
MLGLEPSIHGFPAALCQTASVDGRVKLGHDGFKQASFA